MWKEEGKETPFLLTSAQLVNTESLPAITNTCPVAYWDAKLELQNDQYFRMNYMAGIRSREFSVAEDLEGVTLQLRNYRRIPKQNDTVTISGTQVDGLVQVEPVEVMLDGVPVRAEERSMIPTGFGELYRASLPFTLKKGKHTLTVINESPDFKFLPVALFCGPFQPDYGQSCLHSLPTGGNPGEKHQFFGTACWTMQVEIPNNAEALRLETFRYGKIYLNDRLVGAGYGQQTIPLDTAWPGGRAELKLELKSDLAPLFGDTMAFDREDPESVCSVNLDALEGYPAFDRMEWELASMN